MSNYTQEKMRMDSEDGIKGQQKALPSMRNALLNRIVCSCGCTKTMLLAKSEMNLISP